MFSDTEVTELNARLEGDTPESILMWAWETFGRNVAATSSFQSQSVPLLHIISQVVPDLPILFIDTGFHFPETLTFRDRLTQELGLNVKTLQSEPGQENFKLSQGELYHTNPDLCCFFNKVKPLQNAKRDLQAWVTGIRRDQTEDRAETPIIGIGQDGLYKICPMATWSQRDIWTYIDEHNLPAHPLLAQGYLSIGCAPCTRPVNDGEGIRDGRWAGQSKRECGLHVKPAIEEERKEK